MLWGAGVATIGLIVVIEVVVQVAHASGPANQTQATTWATGVSVLINDSTELEASVQQIRVDAVSIGRRGLDRDLGDLVAAAQSQLDAYATMGLSPPSSSLGNMFTTVLRDRSEGAKLLAGGMELAVGPGNAPDAVVTLVHAGQQLLGADLTYRALVSALHARQGRSDLPVSRWIADPSEWSSGAISSWVAALRAAPGLRTRDAIALVAVSIVPPVVQITGLPTTTTSTTTSTTTTISTTTTTTSSTTTTFAGATSTTGVRIPPSTIASTTTTTIAPTTTTLQTLPPGAVSILPPTPNVVVVVVVANAGDITEPQVLVLATLTPLQPASKGSGHSRRAKPASSPSAAPLVVSEAVGTLAPGASRYLQLPPLTVTDGRTYRLEVSAGSGTRAAMTDEITDSFTIEVAS